MMEKAAKFTYKNYWADGSGYYTDNGETSFVYIKDATPIVLEALGEYSARIIRNM